MARHWHLYPMVVVGLIGFRPFSDGFAASEPAAEPATAEPGKLLAEPLLVAPRAAPESQLLRLRFEGRSPAAPFVVVVLSGEGEISRNAAGAVDPVVGGVPLVVPEPAGEQELTIRAEGDGWRREARATVRPLRPWQLFLVQHTHTDIGYTALPSRLNTDHLLFLDQAVRACRLTDGHPDDARFRWTCEATWAVERYLAQRPPEIRDAFLRRVSEGRIEVTAMRMNMTDLAPEELVVRNLMPVGRLRRMGIPIRTAMQCDVNGYPWDLAALLDEIGVVGLAGGINQTRSTLPFPHPRAIRWLSPSGRGIIAWRGEHYMFANFQGFGESVKTVLERLPGYLGLIERRGYPYRVALLQMAGYYTDNASPNADVCDRVREWNERFVTPRIRVATLSEWFDALRSEAGSPHVEEREALLWPTTRKAWPDWWADGVGSAPLEASVIRDAHETLSFAEGFLALARYAGAKIADHRDVVEEAWLHASLYDEHTFGAAESVDRPDTVNTKSQWQEKAANAYRTRWLATRLEDATMATWAPGAVPRGEAGIVVFNGLGHERSGPVIAEVPRGIVDEGTPFRIVDPVDGQEVPYQFAAAPRNYREIEILARDVPSVGYRVYRLEVGTEPAAAPPAARVEGAVIENEIVRVTLDPARAGIVSISSPDGSGELVDATRDFALGQYVHERIAHPKGRWHLWPMAAKYEADAFRRTGASEGRVEPGVNGPVRTSLRMLSRVDAPSGEVRVETEVSLHRGRPVVHLTSRIWTPGTRESVAGYFAFPFAGTGAPRADVVGGVMVPGRDQIPLSAEDWHSIQRWVRFPAGEGGATWATIDAPLVQFGGFNTGRWTKGLTLDAPFVLSWAHNNYWFTNFVARQSGEFVFRYAVAGGAPGATDLGAHRFGRGACGPLRAEVVDGAGPAAAPRTRSLLRVEPAEVDLVAVKEAEQGSGALIVRVRNRSDQPVVARLVFGEGLRPRSADRVTILEEPRPEGEPGSSPGATLDGARIEGAVAPWAIATFRVER